MFVEGSIEQVASAVQRLARRRDRAILVIGITPTEQEPRLRAALGEAVRADPSAIVAVHAPTADAPRELVRLNRTRDLLLRRARLVLLTGANEAALRAIQAATVDLTSTVDLTFVVHPLDEEPAEDVFRALRLRAREQTALVDLSGLLPADVGASRLRVEGVYMELVSLGPIVTVDGRVHRERPPARRIPRLLVVGAPGGGKTTFLRMLASEYSGDPAGDRLGVGARVPIFVPLPAYARALEDRRATLPLYAFIGNWLQKEGVRGVAGALASRPDAFLLLLDGLDEVRGAAARRAVMEEVNRLPLDGPAVVVSGRTLVLDELTNEQLRHFEIRPARAPDEDDVWRFLVRFFRARGLDHPDKEADEAAAHIGHDPELQGLVRTPLLLVFLALLHELEGRIPDRRFLLYNKVAEILLDRWERARARARGAGVASRSLALGDMRRVIGALAWWMIEGGRDEVQAGDLREELGRIERDRGASASEADARATALTEVLQSGSALLTATGEGRWRFVHATLAEYFAGVEMARGGARWEQVLADVFRVDWQEIVVFGAGELGVRADDVRLSALADALLRRHPRGGRYGASHATLLSAVLAEDPGFPAPLARRLVERFVELCLVPKYWPRSAPAVAQALRATAEIASHRSWADTLRTTLEARVGSWTWRADQDDLADAVLDAFASLGVDTGTLVAALVAHSDVGLRTVGWRARYATAPEPERPALLALALEACPGGDRYDITGDIADFYRQLFAESNGLA